jgi:hypothetical protein
MPGGLTIADLGFKPTYQNYALRHTMYDNESAIQSFNGVSEEEWNKWSDEEKMKDFVDADADSRSMGGALAATNGTIGPDNPHYAEIRAAMGKPDTYTDRIAVAYIPNAATGGTSQWGPVFDPTAHPYSLGGDYYAFDPGMLSQARKDAVHGNRWEFLRNGALLVAAIATGGYAAEALGAGEGAGAALTHEGVEIGAAGATGGAAPAVGTGAATGAGTGIIDESAGLSMTPPTPTPAPTPMPTTPVPTVPEGPAPGPGVPGTQPPAPVTTASPPQPSTGIINSVRNVVQPVSDWYNGLSPAARMVVNQGVSSAAQSALGANAQRNAQDFAREQDDRARADAIRRHQIGAFAPGSFVPKPKTVAVPGIIDTVRATRG